MASWQRLLESMQFPVWLWTKSERQAAQKKKEKLNLAGCLFIAFWPYPTEFNVNSTAGNPVEVDGRRKWKWNRCWRRRWGNGRGRDWRSEGRVVIRKWRLEHKQAATQVDLRHRPSVNRLGSCPPPKCSILMGAVIELGPLRAIKATP